MPILKYLSIIACMVLAFDCHAQMYRPMDGHYFSQPKEYALFPMDTDYLRPINALFYPIGWSDDGKFAYLQEPADEACGCYFLDLLIYDLVTNKEVSCYRYNDQYREKDSTHENETLPDSLKASNLTAAWNLLSAQFAKRLDSFHIIQAADWVDVGTTFSADGHAYRLHQRDEKKTYDDYSEQFVIRYAVAMDRDTVKEKRTFTSSFENYSGVLQVNLLRTFKHPSGKWVAVIYGLYKRGWEGPPNVNDFRVEGLKL